MKLSAFAIDIYKMFPAKFQITSLIPSYLARKLFDCPSYVWGGKFVVGIFVCLLCVAAVVVGIVLVFVDIWHI